MELLPNNQRDLYPHVKMWDLDYCYIRVVNNIDNNLSKHIMFIKTHLPKVSATDSLSALHNFTAH